MRDDTINAAEKSAGPGDQVHLLGAPDGLEYCGGEMAAVASRYEQIGGSSAIRIWQ
jgi:hypothetical protein